MSSRMHHKTSIYLATLIAAIALSACGSKKTGNGGDPAPAPAKTTVEETPATGGSGGIAVPPGDGGGTTPSTPPKPDAPVVQMDPTEEDSGYDPVDPNSVERTDLDKRYTGMEEDGLYYTGSSTDYLLTYLKLRNDDEMLDAAVREANRLAAQSIRSARLVRDRATGDVQVVLKIREGYNTKNYVLSGGVDEEEANSVSKLRLSRGYGKVKTTGTQPIEGKIKCMDLDGGCDTTFVRLAIGPVGARAYVAILFRESAADRSFSISAPEETSGNPEFELFREFLRNSAKENADTTLKIKRVNLKSFEVVNGRSGFEVQIIGVNRQLMLFSGPLLAPDSGTSVKISAVRTPQLQESIDLDNLTNYHYELGNTIGDAKIVNNNGLGQVRLSLKMRKRGGYAQDMIYMTVMRIIKPTLPANQDNLNFN